jgi:diguanylate cyclase (GGDEF)-like protein
VEPLTLTVLFTVAAQAMGALVIAAILTAFHRHHHRPHLRRWTGSWLSLAVSLLAGGVAFAAVGHVPATHPLRLSASVIAGVAGYLQAAWLLIGAVELGRGEPLPRLTVRRGLVAAIALGVATSVPFVWISGLSHLRYATRVGLKGLVVGVAFVLAARLVLRGRPGVLGARMVAAGFCVYGVLQMYYAVHAVSGLVWGGTPPFTAYLGFVDLTAQWIAALGMVVGLLEDEREVTRRLAYHDPLTGLPNRQLFQDRLQLALAQAGRYKQHLAVLFLDLDRFKVINDSLGHTAGDQLLQRVSTRLHGLLREGDTVARVGGDEFMLLLPGLAGVDDAVAVARKVVEAVRLPFVIDGRELVSTTSAGVSVYPEDGTDSENLTKNADVALYRAKERGRDNFQLYTPGMNEQALERLGLETRLRKALGGDEMELLYQPLVELSTGRVLGVEALLRWQHPDLGRLAPAEFLDLAEVTGIINEIGQWVLVTACRQAHAWREEGHHIRVSVNLSARQFLEPDCAAKVRQALESAHLPPEDLVLELTESLAMQRADQTEETLRELKALGVAIAIDDFGTGYSSLAYLRRFPIDAVKIDKSFVRDLAHDKNDAQIVSTIVAMARGLGLRVVAEGVESAAQLDFLRDEGCDEAQGFYLGAPVDAAGLGVLLLTSATR